MQSEGGEPDHLELRQQSYRKEGQVVEEEADTVPSAQLEALSWH